MILVSDLLALLEACDHTIVIYDDNVRYEAAENYGDLLWSSDTGTDVPDDVLAMEVLSYALEDIIFRIWVNGEGIPNKYQYEGWNLENSIEAAEYYN